MSLDVVGAELLGLDVLSAMEALADRLSPDVDGNVLDRVLRLRETVLAKTMEPLQAFDELRLYQLSKASSTQQFLEHTVGLSQGDAQATVILARKLKAMPLTEAAWLAGTLTSGQVRAVVSNVSKRTAEQYTAEEADVLAIIVPLDAKDTAKAMQSWANYAQALLDDDPDKPPREDEFFHSETTGGRFVSNGNFGAVTGSVIGKAIELAETDNPRDNDTRAPPSGAVKPSAMSAGSTSTTCTASPPIPMPTPRQCPRNGTSRTSSGSPPPPK